MKACALTLMTLILASLYAVPCAAAPNVGSASIRSTTGRSAFYENETIPLIVPAIGQSVQVSFSLSGQCANSITVPVVDGRVLVTVAPYTLAPGVWTVQAAQQTMTLQISSSIPSTPFTVCVYQGWLEGEQPAFYSTRMAPEERLRLWRDVYGVNTLMLQNSGFPVPPATVDNLVKARARFTTAFSLAGTHQPLDIRNDWSEAEVITSLRYKTKNLAQHLRYYGGFWGVHYADEPGLTWGMDDGQGNLRVPHPDEPMIAPPGGYFGPMAVPVQREAYRQVTGKEAPNWRTPFAQFDEWMDWMRWRTTIIGDAFATFTQDIKAIDPSLIGYSQIYSWKWIQDGPYPPTTARGVDALSTHGYNIYFLGLWYPAGEVEAMRSGAWDKPLWMLAPWQGITPDDAVRAVVYSSLARKVEGITWPLDWMQSWPQAKEISEKILPISGMLALTEKPRDAVGLFYSRDQHLYSLAQEVEVAQGGQQYPGRISTAWLTALSAGYPNSRLTEEELLARKASAHTVLLCPGLTYARPEIVRALEQYIADGGVVLLDGSATVNLAGAKRLPLTFGDYELAARGTNGQAPSDRALYDALVRPHVQTLADTLAPYVRPAVTFDNPMYFPSIHNAGAGRYLWLVNMTQNERAGTRHAITRASTHVTMPVGDYAAYDVFARKRLTERAFTLDLDGGDARIYALMPEAITTVKLTTATWAQPNLTLSAQVVGKHGAIDAVIPLEVTIRQPDGQLFRTLYRATTGGKYVDTLPIGATALPGQWSIEVKELLSGMEARGTVDVRESAQGITATSLAEVYDGERIAQALSKERGDILVLYGDDSTRDVAETVAGHLRGQGLTVTVDAAANHQTPRPTLPIKSLYLTQAPLELNQQVVLLGNRENNPLIARVVDGYQICPRQLDSGYPGQGRALVYWVNGMFGLHNDIVLIVADDAAGLQLGGDAVVHLQSEYTVSDSTKKNAVLSDF